MSEKVIPVPKKVQRGRLVVVEHVYYKQPSGPPTGISPKYSEMTVADEEAYERRVTRNDSDWEPLDRGWIVLASLLVIINENRAGDILVKVGGTILSCIPPGQSCRLCYPTLTEIFVSSSVPKLKYTVFIVPR